MAKKDERSVERKLGKYYGGGYASSDYQTLALQLRPSRLRDIDGGEAEICLSLRAKMLRQGWCRIQLSIELQASELDSKPQPYETKTSCSASSNGGDAAADGGRTFFGGAGSSDHACAHGLGKVRAKTSNRDDL